jgi:ABC-type sugar transport system ATPase subunit
MSTAASDPAVLVRGLRKQYDSTRALDGVDLTLERAEIHGVIGPNGAGKSTLVKSLAGLVRPDSGEILIDGVPVHFDGPQAAHTSGLAFVHQQLLVAPRMSVLDNIYLGLDTPARFKWVDKGAMRRRLAPTLERMGVTLDLNESIEELSVTQQRFVMIARALLIDARVIVLDEPTASLDRDEVARLFEVLRELRGLGIAILFISHRLGEVLDLCDQVTIIRDGKTRATARAVDLTASDLLRHMGVEHEPHDGTSRVNLGSGAEVLSVAGLTGPGLPRPLSFEVRSGEIVGLAGVVGSGRTRLAKTLVGVIPRTAGNVTINGTRAAGKSLSQSARAGLVLLPENRTRHGLSLAMTVRENVTLGVLPAVYRRSPFGTRRRRVEREMAIKLLTRVGLDESRLESETGALSGGMQQRVMFAKTLAADARVMILDEPTQGVDIATKLSLYELIRDIAADGRGLVVISSELDELVELCDRILCMREGQITAELLGPGLTPSRIIDALWSHREAA